MKNSHLILITLLSSLFSTFSQAQKAEEVYIKASISTFFEGMKEGDTSKISSQVTPNCNLNSVVISEVGNAEIKAQQMSDFIRAIGSKPEGVIYNEEILSYDIKIDGKMAIAWTPYRFYLNDRFIHCGVNVFSLIHDETGIWKIFAISDTRRKENCD